MPSKNKHHKRFQTYLGSPLWKHLTDTYDSAPPSLKCTVLYKTVLLYIIEEPAILTFSVTAMESFTVWQICHKNTY